MEILIKMSTKLSGFKFLICLLLALTTSCNNSQNKFLPEETKAKTTNQQPVKNEELKETKATFLAVGDIMLSRGVNQAIEREGNPLLPFSQLDNLLSSTDFNFGNLESPVSGNEKRLGRGLVFNTHQHDLAGLVKYNFKVVNLANNHALDQRLEGLRFTQKYLEKQGVSHLGVGENKAEAWQPKIIAANGIRIGFIGASYSSINDGGVIKTGYVARIEEFENLKTAIRQLKTGSDFIVVTFHAGIEYTRKPNRSQINFARTAIDSGADLVIGSHPHWIQTFEQYQGRYIFYSLGNFIFDQRKPDTKEGLMLQITLQKKQSAESGESDTKLERIELIPIVIERIGVPRRATSKERQMILKKIGATDSIIVPKFEKK